MIFLYKIEGINGYINVDISLPDWAKYIAQDENGAWWAYEHKPIIREYKYQPDYCRYNSNKCYSLCTGKPPEDFTQELYEVYYVGEEDRMNIKQFNCIEEYHQRIVDVMRAYALCCMDWEPHKEEDYSEFTDEVMDQLLSFVESLEEKLL